MPRSGRSSRERKAAAKRLAALRLKRLRAGLERIVTNDALSAEQQREIARNVIRADNSARQPGSAAPPAGLVEQSTIEVPE